MIQAAPLKSIEPKASKAASGIKSDAKVAVKGANPEVAADGLEFSKELAANMNEVDVKAVEVTADQLLQKPSSLKQEQQTDLTNPKVFDPNLTQDVQQLIGPKTSEAKPLIQNEIQAQVAPLTDEQVLKLANAETKEVAKEKTAEALLKAPELSSASKAGRSPAIDFAKSEIDPQLMNLEDFVAQKNLVNKKTLPHGYNLKTKVEIQKPMLETGLKKTQVVSDVSTQDAAIGTATAGAAIGSQQFILNMMNEQGTPKMNEAAAPQKVFDMSQIKTDNPNQIMNQISDYIVQAKASKEPTVNMRVNHEELGMIDITVSKTAQGLNSESVAINIGAHSVDGKNFFQQNSKELFSHLNQAGITVTDMKVDSPSQSAKNDFDMNHQNQRGSHGEKNFGSEQNQRRHDSNRRQELWDLLNKEAA